MIAEIALKIPFQDPYDYLVPQALQASVKAGCRVLVPLKSKTAIGMVVALKQQAKVTKLKNILQSLDAVPIFNPINLEFISWIAQHYVSSLGEIFHASLPSGLAKPFETVLKLNPNIALPQDLLQHQTAIEWFLDARFQSWLQQSFLIWGLEHNQKPIKTQPVPPNLELPKEPKLVLKPDQQQVLRSIEPVLTAGHFECFLLHGVAGSGKTEVYLQASAQVLKQKKTVLVLVPEIALTPQTVERFRQRFGDLVLVLHSQLTPNQRLKNWWQIKLQPYSVVIGTRSAIFVPFLNLGLIIVDEEHDSSYKQQESPSYNARDAAVKLGSLHSAVVILGSATPSIETYYNAKLQKYQYLKLENQVWKNRDLAFKLVDLKKQPRVGGVFYLSKSLYQAMRATYQKGQQCIVFLNRRGFAAYLNCQNCGLPHFCANCSIPMTWHKNKQKLVCHYCLTQTNKPNNCLQCKGLLREEGIGTQRVEQDLKNLFANSKVLRFDTDNLKNPRLLQQSLALILANEVDFIIGTQLISKGHDFPNIGLVCVLLADMSLNIPDLRAAERTYQLITQVAGRAGRGDKLSAEVWLQAYNPEHPALGYKKDNEEFYAIELKKRQNLQDPPFIKSMLLQVNHPKAEISQQAAQKLAAKATPLLPKTVQILGPAESWLHKRSNRYYWQLLFKCATHPPLQQLANQLLWGPNQFSLPQGARVSVNMDP